MAISLLSNLSYLGENYNFSRDAFATIAEMKAFDADYLPPMYLSYCEEDGKVYLYNDNNTEDATTGKWRVFGEGGEGSDEIYIGDTQPTDENITMWIDTAPDVDNIFRYYDGTEYKEIAPITKLALLADVELTDLADGQFVKWDETEGKWVSTDVVHSVAISSTEPTNEEVKVWVDTTGDSAVIKYRTTDGFASIEAVSELSKLTDVALDDATLAEGQIIKYDATNEKWINTDETKEIHVGTTEPTDENIEFWLDTSVKYDEEYFAQEDIVSTSSVQPTTDSNKVWIDTTNTNAVLKYKDGDEYKAIGGVDKVSELTDVDLTDIADGKILKWSTDDGKWVVSDIDLSSYYTKTETDNLLDDKFDIEHDISDKGKTPIVGSDGNIELRKLNGSDVSITVDGNAKTIQDSLNVANGIPVLDTNGKILATQLPTSARKIVGYIDAENVHTLPDASSYDAGSELVVTSNGTINQSTSFTLTSGKQLTEMEVTNANMLIANGYVFTLSADSELGTVQTFASDKVTLADGTEIDLPYASDLSASSTPAVVQINVAIGDELMMIDGHWVHLSNTSNVSSVNSKGGNVVLTGSDINVTIDGEQKSIQSAIENGDIAGGDAEDVAYANTEHTAWTNVKKALDGLINKVYYVKPSITSFTATPSTTVYEVGQKVSSIAFAWTTNKDITTQTLTDCTLADATVRSATYDTEISANKSFVLSVGDGENTDSKTFSIAFRNKIYFGGATIPDTYDSAFILGLAKSQFATTSKGSYSVSVGSGNYGYIAYPKSFGQISSVYIGGFETTVENCGDISFTNASGGVATYNIVRTGRSGLGSITMEVK